MPGPLWGRFAEDGTAEVGVQGGPTARFRCFRTSTLSTQEAAWVGDLVTDPPILVIYQRASLGGLAHLRERGMAYAGFDGRVHLRAPDLYVDIREPAAEAEVLASEAAASPPRDPFSLKGSRVLRWLLLHPAEYSVSNLAAATELSVATASRAAAGLEAAGLVADASNGVGRERAMTLRSPAQALDAWLPRWEARRVPRWRWDVGAVEPQAAVELLAETELRTPGSWAIGGVYGAATVRRAVEPGDLLVWATPEQITAWQDQLVPGSTRGGGGSVQVCLAPDRWTLQLAHLWRGLPIADPVQLWLDCASGGERAVEAASAVAAGQGWR